MLKSWFLIRMTAVRYAVRAYQDCVRSQVMSLEARQRNVVP